MKRREFLKKQGRILAVTAGMLTIGSAGIAEITECKDKDSTPAIPKAKPVSIDSTKLTEQACQTFIPDKKTCSESLLTAGCSALGIKSDLVPGIALGLAGGIGFQGKTCGVITGSAMVVSLAYSQRVSDYAARKKQTLQATGRIFKAFEKEFGSTDCRTLCGLDLTTPEDRKTLKTKVKAETCTKYVQAGSVFLAEELKRCFNDQVQDHSQDG